jgi:hypothetical protein
VTRGLRRVGGFLAASLVMVAASVSPATAALAGSQTAASASSAGAAQAAAFRHARPTRPSYAATALAAMTPVAVANAAGASQGRLLANFDGVGSRDSGITNFGVEFQPPDQGLCVGNGFVVEMVNSAYRVYTTGGTSLAGPFNINKVFHDGFKQFTSDPRCHYDPATNTWFAVILFLNNPFTRSRLEVAMVQGDPRGTWTQFKTDTSNLGGNGCPCFGDQPTLGIDASNLYVTTNDFSIQGPAFNGAHIYAISKKDLINNPTAVHFVEYPDLHIGGAQAHSVQPALTFGSANAEYFLSSLDPNGTGDHRIGVWALTNVSAVDAGGAPVLSKAVILSEPYSQQPLAAQKGSTTRIDSGDDRMQQVQFINGQIWGALGTGVVVDANPRGTPHAGAAWFSVQPRLAGSKLEGASIAAQGYVLKPGEDVTYPAIQADAHGHAAIVFTLTSANRYPSSAYAVMSGGAGFGSPIVSADGTGPYDPTAARWGDYSWAVLDPGGKSVWMATDYIPPVSSQTADGRRNWGTRVIEVALS